MDYYQLATDKLSVAKLTRDAGFYADSVYASCLSIEFYLKSVMHRVPSAQEYEFTHDVINLYKEINSKYRSKKDLLSQMKACRKYNNESRYPYSGTDVFTKDFADKFISYANDTKDYIDNECAITLSDLESKPKKI